jgi:Major Facilitator Superfamily
VVSRSRLAVLAIFFVDGAVIATWAAQIPLIQEKFGLSSSILGLALFAGAAGSVVSLFFVGALIARVGSRLITSVTSTLVCLGVALLVLVPTFPLLIATLVLFGLSLGALDVAMNAQAVAVETRAGRPSMSTFHALFSTGGLAGAAVASVLLSRGMNGSVEALLAAVGLAVLASLFWRWLLPSGREAVPGGSAVVLPTGPLLALGILTFLALLSEGSMADWSALYLRTSLGTSPSLAATGFAAFSLAMAASRFVGDWLRKRVSAVGLLQFSGGLAALGLGVALLIGQPVAAIVGYGCVGLALANVVPILFSAAGRVPGVSPGSGIGAVATVGYLGFLAGPAAIGFVAQSTTLAGGLGVVVLCLALIVPLAGNARVADSPGRISAPIRDVRPTPQPEKPLGDTLKPPP